MKFRVIVVGDIMLDRYVFVRTYRQAPEAPIPVWDEVREEYRLGGAANTANNLKSIGDDEVEVHLAGIFRQTYVNKALVEKQGIDTTLCNHGRGMVKNRFVDEKEEKIIFRSDTLQKFDPASVDIFEQQLVALGRPIYDAAIISDYAKGTVTSKVVETVRGLAPVVIVDSKRMDLSLFEGFEVLKVNAEEHGIQASMERIHYGGRCVESLFDYVVVTRGPDGADILQCEPTKSNDRRSLVHRFNVPTQAVETVKDVTGCGDTHTAAMTFSLLKNGRDMTTAVRFANACARSVVQKFGTSTASRDGLVVSQQGEGT